MQEHQKHEGHAHTHGPIASSTALTITSPRNIRSFVARSRRGLNLKRSGVLSISVVVAFPERKVSCASFLPVS